MSSNSSVSRTITFTRKSGNFTSYITCDKGDVYVDYEKDGDFNDSNYNPLFSAANPRLLALNIINSMNVPFNVISVTWRANGKNVQTEPGLSAIYAVEDGGLTLRIKGSIAAASLNQSITITAEALLNYATTENTIVRASYYIPVRQSSGNVWHVTIAACDAKSNYTINNGENIKVKCLVYDPKGVEQQPSQYQYKWYKIVNGEWQQVNTGIVNNEITIDRSQVDNQAMFKVEVYAPKTEGGFETEPLGFDTQMIYDALDEYSIIVTPSRDEEIEQGSATGIDYKITIFNTDKNANARKALVSFFLHAWGALIAHQALDLDWDNSQTDTSVQGTTYGPNTVMFSVTEQDFLDNGSSSLVLDINAQILEG